MAFPAEYIVGIFGPRKMCDGGMHRLKGVSGHCAAETVPPTMPNRAIRIRSAACQLENCEKRRLLAVAIVPEWCLDHCLVCTLSGQPYRCTLLASSDMTPSSNAAPESAPQNVPARSSPVRGNRFVISRRH